MKSIYSQRIDRNVDISSTGTNQLQRGVKYGLKILRGSGLYFNRRSLSLKMVSIGEK